jgi:thiol-disulfide isomerase/thioredoxin
MTVLPVFDKFSSQNDKTTIAAALILNDSNFAQAIQKYPLLVVDFWTPWWGPCRVLNPSIEQLAWELAGKVVEYTFCGYLQEWSDCRWIRWSGFKIADPIEGFAACC